MLGIKLGKISEAEKIFCSRLQDTFRAYELPSAILPGIAGLAARASGRGTVFNVHAPHPFNSDVNIASLDDRVREESVEACVEAVDMAAGIGARALVIHCGTARERRTEALVAARSSIEEIAGCARNKGVQVTVENDSAVPGVEGLSDDERFSIGTLCRVPEEVGFVLSGLEGVGLTFDVGHAYGTARYLGLDPYCFMERTIKAAGRGRLSSIHVTDISGMADFHRAVGEGEIDFRRVFELIRGFDFDGPVILENFPRDIRRSVVSLGPYFRRFFHIDDVPSADEVERFCAELGWG